LLHQELSLSLRAVSDLMINEAESMVIVNDESAIRQQRTARVLYAAVITISLAGGTVVVAPGRYSEDVRIDWPMQVVGHCAAEVVVLGAEGVDVGFGLLVHDRGQLVDRVGVAVGPEARLNFDLVPIGVCTTSPSFITLDADFFHLEAVDECFEPVSPGERGRLVITRLWGNGTPIIRYTGMEDWITLGNGESCSCGLKSPIFGKPVEGRILSNIQLFE